jgi:hypothetical protein
MPMPSRIVAKTAATHVCAAQIDNLSSQVTVLAAKVALLEQRVIELEAAAATENIQPTPRSELCTNFDLLPATANVEDVPEHIQTALRAGSEFRADFGDMFVDSTVVRNGGGGGDGPFAAPDLLEVIVPDAAASTTTTANVEGVPEHIQTALRTGSEFRSDFGDMFGTSTVRDGGPFATPAAADADFDDDENTHRFMTARAAANIRALVGDDTQTTGVEPVAAEPPITVGGEEEEGDTINCAIAEGGIGSDDDRDPNVAPSSDEDDVAAPPPRIVVLESGDTVSFKPDEDNGDYTAQLRRMLVKELRMVARALDVPLTLKGNKSPTKNEIVAIVNGHLHLLRSVEGAW